MEQHQHKMRTKKKTDQIVFRHKGKERNVFTEMKMDFLEEGKSMTVPEMIEKYWDVSKKDSDKVTCLVYDKKQRKLVKNLDRFVQNIDIRQCFPSEFEDMPDEIARRHKLRFRAVKYSEKYKRFREYKIISNIFEVVLALQSSTKQIVGRMKPFYEMADFGLLLEPGNKKVIKSLMDVAKSVKKPGNEK